MKKLITLISILSLASILYATDIKCGNSFTSLKAGNLTITGVTDNHIYYVDGARTDSYTATGQADTPYTTISDALTAITANAALHSNYEETKYIINVAPGTYDENLTIGNLKYLRVNMQGVIISGNITQTTTQQSGDYYSKLEWNGGNSNRPEKGEGGCITGTYTASRNNDSLIYVSFIGMNLEGTSRFQTDGTWVLYYSNCFYKAGAFLYGADFNDADSSVLIETDGQSEFYCHISSPNADATDACFYSAKDAMIDFINTAPTFESRFVNCRFNSNVTINAQNIYVDANSYKSLVAQTETLSGATVVALDGILPDATVVDTSIPLQSPKLNLDTAYEVGVATPTYAGQIMRNAAFEVYIGTGTTDCYQWVKVGGQ